MRLTNQEERVIRGIVEKVKANVAAPLAKEAAKGGYTESQLKAAVAQNAMASLITCVFGQFTPFDEEFSFSMAVRLASYAISTAPLDRQGELASHFGRIFEKEHARRIAAGIMIPTQWISE
jgi:hypothetical protein